MGISRAAEHTKECYRELDWLHLKTVCILPYMCKWKNRKSLKINELVIINEKDKSFPCLTRDNVDYVIMNSWKLIFMKMRHHWTINIIWRNHYDVNICNILVWKWLSPSEPEISCKKKKKIYLVFCLLENCFRICIERGN